MLFFEEPGLEVKYEDEWRVVSPKAGTVVINLGNALELMTSGRCCSMLHRVVHATDNRQSLVYFVNPNYQQPVKNYVDKTIIALTGAEFFRQQFNEHYI